MSQERISTAIGMITGVTCKIMVNDMAIAILTAFVTGGAAYIGQLFVKYLYLKIKTLLNEKSTKKVTKQDTRFF
jgi:hypothetical protein